VLIAVLLLALFEGSSIRSAGEEMDPGVARELTLAVGAPAGWIADRLPFDEWTDDALAFLEDDGVGDQGGFGDSAPAVGGARGVPAVPPSSFDPAELGARPAAGRLGTLLVTGDSLAMPLDVEMARRYADAGWAAAYAYRVRRMMNTYRRGGRARVYWLTLPAPRDKDRQEVARSVNAAIEVAAQPYRAQVRVLDMDELFTPGGRYRDAMEVDGRREIVREPDGIHLNGQGAELAADAVMEAVERDFGG
jgi:hypothetical protein